MTSAFHSSRPVDAAQGRQHGFSLVELMIAVTVSLIMMIALGALLLSVNRNNNELIRTNSQIENGRFAIQLLQTEVAQAGFWGPHVPDFDDRFATMPLLQVPTAVPDPCLAYSVAAWDAAHLNNLTGIPLQASTTVPGTCAGVVTGKKANTDVLVVRRADTCTPGEPNCTALTAGQLYYQASLCPMELSAGQRYLIGTSGLNLQAGACNGTLAPLRRFMSNIYWIRDFSETAGDGVPTLVRSQFGPGATPGPQAAEPLVEGIEGFNVELGIDSTVTRCALNTAVNYALAPALVDPTTCAASATAANNTLPTNRGDGIADGAFIRCTTAAPCTPAQLMNVVAVKLYVLARTREATPGHRDTKTYNLGTVTLGPFNDGFKRHVFTTTVRLVNISGRRETP